MSTELDSVDADRLNSIERRLEEMIERKWTPLREKHGKEPIEIEKTEDSVVVGYLDKYGADLLRDDVIRLFNTGYYDIDTRCTDQGEGVAVRPISASEFTLSRTGRTFTRQLPLRGSRGPASTFRRFTVLPCGMAETLRDKKQKPKKLPRC